MLTNRYRRREGSLSLYRPQPKSASRVQQVYTSLRTPTLPPLTDDPPESPTVKVPVSDMHIPSISMVKSLTEIPTIACIEDLPALPAVYERKFVRIFRKKLELCTHICSFSGDPCEEPVIIAKQRALEEIHGIFTGSACVTDSLEQSELEALFAMVKKNIIRTIHPLEEKFLLHDDLPAPEEPAWPHLSLVYQIMNRLSICIPCSHYFAISFLTELTTMFETSDQNERNMLVQLYINIVHGNSRIIVPLLDLLERVLIDYRMQDFASPFIPATVFPILSYIFNHKTPPLPIFHRVFSRAIVPIFKDRWYQTYGQSVKRIVELFVDDDFAHAREVVDMISSKWSLTRPEKEVQLLQVLYDTLGKMSPREQRTRVGKVLRIIARAIKSDHEKVALAALGIWQKLDSNEAIANNIKLAVSILVPAICQSMASHWSQNVKTAARSGLSVLQRYDLKLVQEQVRQFRERSFDDMAEEAKPKKWTTIIRTAFDKDGGFNLSKSLQSVTETFAQPKVVAPEYCHFHTARDGPLSHRAPPTQQTCL